ncbi:DUF2800 domain-containing protein [Sporolactobacillus kofuensis]|uniref:DUF2800 domain-containing protein n=1 Tax=Sporolactobacillus kofuensis TaxID=269672 RepID=A0ABW1WDH3_9BACL|nr:DUF2800 domain-containing protein [Sporolactobacillus kofuensis]MCO7175534.1 DUF2800 domain-containing protein [Sporolactobacillus kofuensis]
MTAVKEIDHAHRSHALLGASGAHKWLNCTPSARLEEQFPDTTSEYAKEGTLAHEIAELKLRKYFIEPMSSRTYNTRMNKFKRDEHYDDEMDKHTDTYLEYLKELSMSRPNAPFVTIEQRMDYSDYAPGGFGTADCIMIEGDTLFLNDFKYGKGVPVSAENNPQMMLYALGALKKYGILYPIEQVHLAIIQPRLDNISEWVFRREDLVIWGKNLVKPKAALADAGEGEFVPGDHCRFCRAKAQCRAYAGQFTALQDFGAPVKKPALLTDEEIGKVINIGQHLDNWIKAVKEYALSQCLAGNEIPGWKAVEGRGSRNYVDQDKAFAYLTEHGIDENILYDRVPLTVPKVEKLLKKKQYDELLVVPGLVEKTQGKPTLAPAKDKRQAITSATQDFS